MTGSILPRGGESVRGVVKKMANRGLSFWFSDRRRTARCLDDGGVNRRKGSCGCSAVEAFFPAPELISWSLRWLASIPVVSCDVEELSLRFVVVKVRSFRFSSGLVVARRSPAFPPRQRRVIQWGTFSGLDFPSLATVSKTEK